MNKMVKQFVWGGASSGMNSNVNEPKAIFCTSGSLLTHNGSALSVVSFGIQAPEGTQFFVNGSTSPCVIGKTGIFEWDVEGYGYITDLYFKLPNGQQDLGDTEYILVNVCYVS